MKIGSSALGLYLTFYLAFRLLFVLAGYDLFSEEAQYWLWGQFPDWSYYSKPPLIAWVNGLMATLVHSDKMVRLSALLFGTASLFVFYRLARYLFDDKRTAVLAVVLLSASPFFILQSSFFTTDTLVGFFWLLTYYLFFRAFSSNKPGDWILAGVSFGLGCLSKYAMFFFLLVIIPLVSVGKKSALPGFFVMVIVGVVLFSPVIYWNASNDWVSVRHVDALATSSKGFELQRSLMFLLEFALGILVMFSPFLLLLFLFKRFRRHFFTAGSARETVVLRILIWPTLFVITVFLMMSVVKRVEVNWPAFSYASIPIAMAWAVARSGPSRRVVVPVVLTLGLVIVVLFPSLLDHAGLSKALPVKNDSLKRLAGWSALAEEVRRIQSEHPYAVDIITDDYHIASELAFYTGQLEPYCLNRGRRMNQLDVWSSKRITSPHVVSGVYVTWLPGLPPGVSPGSVRAQLTYPVYYRGALLHTFNIFVLRDFVIHPPDPFNSF